MRITIKTALLYLVFLLAGASAAPAAVCTVDALTDTGAGSGTTGDLRYCITQTNAAPGADTIGFTVSGTVLLDSNLPYISDSLTINGPGQSFFIVDAQSGTNRRGFEIDAPAGVAVTIRNLTIRNGNITSGGIGSGGGISLVSGATLNLDFVSIVNNASVDGGAGVNVNGSTLNVTNSRITGNSSTGAGAGGGAINFFNGSLFMSATTVSGNTASNGGAFAFVFVNPARVENSTVSGNNALRGGAFYNAASTVRMSNVTVSGNTASDLGGGFVNASNNGSVTLRNCTVAANTAANTGGGFYNYGGTNISTTLANTIVADNRAVNGADVYNSFSSLVLLAGANIVETGIAGSGGIGGGGSAGQTDPLLLPLGNYGGATATHNFAPNSPARDAGANGEALDTSANPLTLDQRGSGFARLAGGAVDIGAYEFASVVVTTTADTNDGVCDADCSLREAVAAAPNGANVEFSALFDAPRTIVLGSLIDIPKSLTIFGPGADRLTVSGNNATTLFENFSASAATINFVGLTFANGNGVGGNNNNQGGAVEMHGAGASFDRVVFRDNSAALGGAMLCLATICRISNSTFYNNSAGQASVLYGGSVNAEIVNSTFSGNTETAGGYGTLYLRGTVVIRNSTFAGNSGFSHLYLSTELASLTLGNTIVAGGPFTDIYRAGGTVTSNGGNVLGKNSNAGPTFAAAGTPNANLDFVGTSAAPVNPLLAPLANYGGPTPTRALLPGSPALNNGVGCVVDNSCAPAIAAALTVDQRGAPRLIGAAVDSGAFETNVTIEPATLPNGNTIQVYNQQLTATRLTSFAGNRVSKETAAFAPTDFALVPVAGQTLPPGVTLSSGGLLAGMPTAGGTYTFTVRATDADGAAGVRQYTVQILVPTAANVSVSGRITATGGNGIGGARVTLTDSHGNSRTVSTGTFGNYLFDDVAVGETYVVTVVSKRHSFAPQVIAVADAVTELNFAAAE
ncbi:MAG: CSLREA domain-containing protein [Acidobacteria bacterium]|nr:CSLREA domain-containing protein [Acidobacteriota bacterium]